LTLKSFAPFEQIQFQLTAKAAKSICGSADNLRATVRE
jgi:hypothetical protein